MIKKKVFGTLEWASHNENFINGCKHDCLYCYSKEMAIRFGRKKPDTWKIEEVRTGSFNKKIRKYPGQIMFPSSHDITPENLSNALLFLDRILKPGNKALIVSKPHLPCVERICQQCKQHKNRILFRFTIGSSNSKFLKFWEPNAPTAEERLECLKHAFNAGYKTSVSVEPMLDTLENINMLIDLCLPFVTDAIWLGRANSLIRRLKINGVLNTEVERRATELLTNLSDDKIRKFYETHKNDQKLKWKDSIKTIVGLKKPANIGCDV